MTDCSHFNIHKLKSHKVIIKKIKPENLSCGIKLKLSGFNETIEHSLEHF